MPAGRCDAAGLLHGSVRRTCAMRAISSLGAMLESCPGPAEGDRVALELPSGQRPTARVVWSDRCGTVGIAFDDSIDIIALLNRQLVSQAPERRTMPRLDVRCPVHVKAGGEFMPATLRNISAEGLQVEGRQLPAAGTFVGVVADGLIIPPGEIVWRKGTLGGVELFETLSWSSVVPWVRELVRRSGN